ncbi:hypothetical protein SNE40_009565 [Patella caerulea]|uniref:Uncharacterized protein n=1 Tax=Patella caerulea TaxID=87958 RepID=A0AAN8JZA7_PATCE
MLAVQEDIKLEQIAYLGVEVCGLVFRRLPFWGVSVGLRLDVVHEVVADVVVIFRVDDSTFYLCSPILSKSSPGGIGKISIKSLNLVSRPKSYSMSPDFVFINHPSSIKFGLYEVWYPAVE